MVEERWATNKQVRIHFLDSDPGGKRPTTPMMFVPGMLGAAEDYLPEIEALASRRCLAMSLRARGRSDAPVNGYAFEDHVADIEAVVAAANLSHFCMHAYSVGVPYAIGFASRFPDLLRGLMLIDYPARYPAFSTTWVSRAEPYMHESKRHAAAAIQRESRKRLLWEVLAQLSCPVLVLRGGREDSLLSSEDARKYQRQLKQVIVRVFEDSGHEIWRPDRSRYLDVIAKFLDALDSR